MFFAIAEWSTNQCIFQMAKKARMVVSGLAMPNDKGVLLFDVDAVDGAVVAG